MKDLRETNQKQLASLKKESGSTMIEIMVAVLVFSIGLLGIASTQTMGLTNTQSALNRNYATQLAYEIMDLVRLNPAIATGISGNPNDPDPTVAMPSFRTPNQLLNNAGLVATPGCTAANTGCTSAQLAQDDLINWSTRVANTLPNGQGRIALNNLTGEMTVTLTWRDIKSQFESGARDAQFNQANNAGATAAQQAQITDIAGNISSEIFSYSISFMP